MQIFICWTTLSVLSTQELAIICFGSELTTTLPSRYCIVFLKGRSGPVPGLYTVIDIYVSHALVLRCICGHLKHKTRLLVTHQLQYLKHVDRIIVLDHVRIKCYPYILKLGMICWYCNCNGKGWCFERGCLTIMASQFSIIMHVKTQRKWYKKKDISVMMSVVTSAPSRVKSSLVALSKRLKTQTCYPRMKTIQQKEKGRHRAPWRRLPLRIAAERDCHDDSQNWSL